MEEGGEWKTEGMIKEWKGEGGSGVRGKREGRGCGK